MLGLSGGNRLKLMDYASVTLTFYDCNGLVWPKPGLFAPHFNFVYSQVTPFHAPGSPGALKGKSMGYFLASS